MIIWISWVLPLSNFKRPCTSWASIIHPNQKLWSFEFAKSFRVQLRASWYIMRLNQTFEWKVMTISISRELPLLNFERLDMWCSWIGPPCDNLWPFEFLERFRCSISTVSIYDVLESDHCVKSYDHLNFLRSSVVQFRASPYVMCLNRTSERKVMTILISRELLLFNFELWYMMLLKRTSVWKVMTIWISRDLPWFNFGRLHMWCAWIGPPCEKLWQFQFLESFRRLILIG